MLLLMALYEAYYYKCRHLYIFTFFFSLGIILPFIIHHLLWIIVDSTYIPLLNVFSIYYSGL